MCGATKTLRLTRSMRPRNAGLAASCPEGWPSTPLNGSSRPECDDSSARQPALWGGTHPLTLSRWSSSCSSTCPATETWPRDARSLAVVVRLCSFALTSPPLVSSGRRRRHSEVIRPPRPNQLPPSVPHDLAISSCSHSMVDRVRGDERGGARQLGRSDPEPVPPPPVMQGEVGEVRSLRIALAVACIHLAGSATEEIFRGLVMRAGCWHKIQQCQRWHDHAGVGSAF